MNFVRAILRDSPLRNLVIGFRHRGIKNADVFLASYPKSGNTWLKFILGEAIAGHEVDFVSVEQYVPLIGKHVRFTGELPQGGRLIKTHEPYRPEYKKAIYLVRDVRDVLVSYFYHQLFMRGFSDTIDKFIPLFLEGRLDGYGRWDRHVRSWLDAARTNPNIKVVKYEDLRKKTKDTVTQIIEFIGIEPDPSKVKQLVEHNSLNQMKKKEQEAFLTIFKDKREDIGFVRKGSVGGWRETLNPEDHRNIERIAADVLKRLGYSLEH